MPMGDYGMISRFCGEGFGSAVTFGASGIPSAPGQIEVGNLNKMLRLLHDSMNI